jgi:very-short-patch-repair endonuclease
VRRGGCAIKKNAAKPPKQRRRGGRCGVCRAQCDCMPPRRSGIYNTRSNKNFRKQLRNSLTAAEAVLWQNLRGRQLLGKKFRRQVSIGRYIVDFYCPEAGLVIELDGDRHFSITIDEYEAQRTKYLEEESLRIIRFENKELYQNLEGVLEAIKEVLND